MIAQYRLKLNQAEGGRILNTAAYRLYAWLLEQVDEEYAEYAHRQENRCLSQYLSRDTWVINLFGEEAGENFGAVLENTKEIHLNGCVFSVADSSSILIEKAEDILNRGRELSCRKAELRFLTPTSFRQAGRYAIYPEPGLLVQSLLMGWNQLCPSFLLDDKDVESELKKGIHIVDYSLRTARFKLKDTAIPGFWGWASVEARLPVVLLEIWNALLYFSQFSGLGIKTALGMGGLEVYSLGTKTGSFLCGS